ncbi:MAG: aldo/keto reductase [Candidatus Dadabacteria bacterium CSP1-2]|nr:MAG: aldo/keto reductase [Candidatus Dadabacteria bacterium CSP1-2]
MKLKRLGRTNVLVSEIGFGAWAISGRGYGPTDDKDSIRALHRALDLGVNFIDTADIYGDGHSEELIGRVLRERNDKEAIIATKFGWDFYRDGGIRSNLKRNYISFALEKSLKRLGREWIDIYQIHNSKPDDIERDNVYETLDEFKKQGKIRFYGVSAYYVEDGIEAIKTGKPDTIQIIYNILEQEVEEKLFPLAIKNDIGIIAREPLASGLLTGKYNENSKFPKTDHRHGWSKKFLEESARKVSRLKFLEKEGQTLIQAALRFSLSYKAVSVVIPGAKTINQVEENISAAEAELNPNELKRIRELYRNNFLP